ncbi:MAG: hypothetical protein ACYDAC_01900 [Candidatus Dormibacteria bacterium]
MLTRMIQETCTRIGELETFWSAEIRNRHARRDSMKEIDDLLNQFEMLNLADEVEIPGDLRRRVATLVAAEHHPLAALAPETVAIPEWMDALYDLQDRLMVRYEDDID